MTKTNKRSVIHFIGQLFNNDLVPIPVMKFILNDLGHRVCCFLMEEIH